MKLVTFLLFLALVSHTDAFAPVGTTTPLCAVPSNPSSSPSLFSQRPAFEERPPLMQMIESETTGRSRWRGSRVASKCAGLISGLSGFVARGMAEDMEYAELPPPYVPALFGVVLLAGIGVLTASLGDVMTEGTSHLISVHTHCTENAVFLVATLTH